MMTNIPEQYIIATLRAQLPELLAIYLFGSHAQGSASPASDVDLAVLVAGKLEPLRAWELAQMLASTIGCEVDLLDLRAASTVMQYQIITTGRRLWEKDAQAVLFESAILSQKTALDAARFQLMLDIRKR